MALSSQHLAKIDKSAVMISEMHAHRSTAMQLFRDALSSSSFQPLLDTLLILINFEASMLSFVRMYSDNVHRLLNRRMVCGMYI
jgi:hypothetical protein